MFTKIFRIAILVVGLCITCVVHAYSQPGAPQAVNYQGVLRNSDGSPMSSRSINIRLAIISDTVNFTQVYAEVHSTSTDDLGLFAVELGRGQSTTPFSSIVWGNRKLWLTVSVDEDGSGPGAYVNMGKQEIISVPYALYADRARYADTAQHVAGFAVGMGVAYGTGDSLRYLMPAEKGWLLVSTGNANPEWKPISSIIDGPIADTIVKKIIQDTAFFKGLSDTIRVELARDTAFIKYVANDSLLKSTIVRIIDSTLNERPIYEVFRDSLIRDRYFTDTLNIILRDSLLTDQYFITQIAGDSILQQTIANSTNFITELVDNRVFNDSLTKIIERVVADQNGNFWSLTGNVGTDSRRNFIGTIDRQDVVIRAGNEERIRATWDGKVGVNLNVPNYTMDINGELNITKDFRMDGDAGAPGYILVSHSAGVTPEWTPPSTAFANLTGEILLIPGTTLVTINEGSVTVKSRIILTIEDLEDTGFIFAQVVSKDTGSFKVRMSAPVISNKTKLMFMVTNP